MTSVSPTPGPSSEATAEAPASPVASRPGNRIDDTCLRDL